jgi:hypothetical protein
MEKIKLTGKLAIKITRKNEVILIRGANTVVNAGKDWAAARLAASPPNVMGWFEFGDNGTAMDPAHTALQGALNPPGRLTITTTTVLANTVSYVRSFTNPGPGDIQNIREIGIFNAASGGTMLARFLVQAFPMFQGDQIDLTWTLTVG